MSGRHGQQLWSLRVFTSRLLRAMGVQLCSLVVVCMLVVALSSRSVRPLSRVGLRLRLRLSLGWWLGLVFGAGTDLRGRDRTGATVSALQAGCRCRYLTLGAP